MSHVNCDVKRDIFQHGITSCNQTLN